MTTRIRMDWHLVNDRNTLAHCWLNARCFCLIDFLPFIAGIKENQNVGGERKRNSELVGATGLAGLLHARRQREHDRVPGVKFNRHFELWLQN